MWSRAFSFDLMLQTRTPWWHIAIRWWLHCRFYFEFFILTMLKTSKMSVILLLSTWHDLLSELLLWIVNCVKHQVYFSKGLSVLHSWVSDLACSWLCKFRILDLEVEFENMVFLAIARETVYFKLYPVHLIFTTIVFLKWKVFCLYFEFEFYKTEVSTTKWVLFSELLLVSSYAVAGHKSPLMAEDMEIQQCTPNLIYHRTALFCTDHNSFPHAFMYRFLTECSFFQISFKCHNHIIHNWQFHIIQVWPLHYIMPYPSAPS